MALQSANQFIVHNGFFGAPAASAQSFPPMRNPNTNVGITNITNGTGSFQAPKEIPTEIVAEPIEAWRMWRVVKPQDLRLTPEVLKMLSKKWKDGENPFEGLLGTKLCGVGNSVSWDQPIHDAYCTVGVNPAQATSAFMYSGIAAKDHSKGVPAQYCTCGVWALNSEENLWRTIMGYDQNGGQYVYGKVQLWGRIIEHKQGYRAAHARPTELHLVRGDQETADELAAFYGCSCDAVGEPERVTEMRRPPDPATLQIAPGQNYNYTQITTAPMTTPPGSIYRMPSTGQAYQQMNSTTLQKYQTQAAQLFGYGTASLTWAEDQMMPKMKAAAELEKAKQQGKKKNWLQLERQKYKK